MASRGSNLPAFGPELLGVCTRLVSCLVALSSLEVVWNQLTGHGDGLFVVCASTLEADPHDDVAALEAESNMKRCIPFLILIGAALLGPAVIRAQSSKPDVSEASIPRLVQFNGTLKDAGARPVTGVASVTFAIYAEQDGGTALWNETQNVIADPNGHFNALLGGATSAGMPAELFGTGQSRWLGVTVARQQELPRVLLASVPYALKAGDAETLGGLPASAYVTTQSLAARSMTPGLTTVLATPLEISAQPTGAPAAAAVPQATPTGGGTTDFVPLWTSASALGNSLIYQTGGKIGIGTTTPTETLDVNGNSIFRGSFQLPPGHDAIASSGYESHSFQFQASSYNSGTKASTTQSFGFRAEPLNNNTTNPPAQLDLFFIPNGGSDFVNTGVSWSSTGIMTFAPGQTFPSLTLTGPIFSPNSSGSSSILIVGDQPFIANYGSIANSVFGPDAGGGRESSATYNTAVGLQAAESLTTGADNTAVGVFSLASNQTANNNSAYGDNALTNTTGQNNTGLGAFAGQSNVAGTNNVFIGEEADALSPNLTNATAIGVAAAVGASNTMVLGGTGSFAVNVGIGTSTPQSMLELSSPATTSMRTAPAPQITLTNTAGGAGANVSIDFNTSAPIYGTGYNPSARIEAVDTGGFTDGFLFESNRSGQDNNGLLVTMSIDASGNVTTGGNLAVGGTLKKAGGSFQIDDPIDPSGKYLSHSFVESPDMMNIYNGNVVLDARGRAAIQMPEWFDALNRDFRYQLTAIGAPGPRLYIAQEIRDNCFQIAGGKPGMKVSWMVTGIRHDAWANAHRIPVEEEKPANEQGHYLHPELFGALPEKGIPSSHGNAVPVSAPAAGPTRTRSTGGGN